MAEDYRALLLKHTKLLRSNYGITSSVINFETFCWSRASKVSNLR